MAWLRVIWTVSFFAAPIAAGVLGYRYQGWLGAVLFPIVAVILVMAALVGVVIFLASLKYRSDRARVSRLSAEQLQALLETPTNPDFRFAFFELSKRGLDVSPARQLLLEMLTSNVAKERNTALERLWEIYPAVRHRFEIGPTDDPPKEVRAQGTRMDTDEMRNATADFPPRTSASSAVILFLNFVSPHRTRRREKSELTADERR